MADFGRRFGEFWPEFEDLLTTDDLKKLMGPKGPLSAWEQFENRPEQIQMALEVQRAMDDDDLTIIEAGTGTGKTLAYLLPALLSEKTTVVSTGLKNLQDQIYQKDIVFLKKFFKFDFNVAIIKGRDNYVCRRLLSGRGANARPLLEDQGWKKNLIDWALDAVTGLLEDIPKELSQQIPKTAKISSSRESCRGRSCLFFRRCFYYGNIARAAKSQIILVNHNIFVIDLNLKTGGDSEGRGIIPEWDAAILDEAHLLEGVATDCLGYHFDVNESLKTFDQLMDLFEKGAFSESPEALAVLEACEEITELLNALPTRYDETFSERELYPNDTPQNRARNQELKALFNDISEKTEALTRKLPSPKAGEQNPP
ncbi:MAG: hypothetical protein LBF38_04610, partial [Deltaproteobacteria bacterium]|nr:hypothetical protein [Deltaproteobacteria bacterium]